MKPEQISGNTTLETSGKPACAHNAQADLSCLTRRRSTFVVLALLWVVLDAFTKAQFRSAVSGRILFGPVLGLFDFRLVHNTGGAWGIFSDSTLALGIFALVVCAALTIYFFVVTKHLNMPETIGLALVVAGGIGNALDRFILGYVVDFIEFAFIDFPIFNVADIGVTCGFVILIIGLIIDFSKKDSDEMSTLEGEEG